MLFQLHGETAGAEWALNNQTCTNMNSRFHYAKLYAAARDQKDFRGGHGRRLTQDRQTEVRRGTAVPRRFSANTGGFWNRTQKNVAGGQ